MSLEAKEVARARPVSFCRTEPVHQLVKHLRLDFLGIFGFEVAVRLAMYVKPWSNMSLWVDIICLVPLVFVDPLIAGTATT